MYEVASPRDEVVAVVPTRSEFPGSPPMSTKNVEFESAEGICTFAVFVCNSLDQAIYVLI